MPASRFIRAEAAGTADEAEPVADPASIRDFLSDASGSGPGRAAGVLHIREEGQASSFLRRTVEAGIPVLPQAARTSLTAGAIPAGEVVLSVAGLDRIGPVRRIDGGALVTAGAGVRLRDLQAHAAAEGYYFPPVPTYAEAMIGGTAATNAGGAATFKYGVTRDWIRGLRVVLDNGDVLALERGRVRAAGDERFEIGLSAGGRRLVPRPAYTLPDVRKISAGYHSADPLDLIDLFIGSEGTLGLITEVTVGLVPLPAAVASGLVFVDGFPGALSLAEDLRRHAANPGAQRLDVRAIEYVDGRSLELLRSAGIDARLRVPLPAAASAAITFELELAEALPPGFAERLWAGEASGHPLAVLLDLLERRGVADDAVIALPGDEGRRRAIVSFRESVPLQVNEILSRRGLGKVGGDVIVPFDRLSALYRTIEREFRARGLDFAVWGHLSDGNLHPNAIPADAAASARGGDALLAVADAAVRCGGCPLSEHGVGRNPLKQEMLRRFLGNDALRSMRAIKRAIDPGGRFAPGVLFS